jgi:hypothetical protein
MRSRPLADLLCEIEFGILNGNLVVRCSSNPISIGQQGAAYLEKMQTNTN